MRVIIMMAALILSAFVGASAGLVWQASDWFTGDQPNEVVTVETPD
ncbi:MAG: hypothetical protein WA957_02105 [Alteraurantiacibacter sp.]